MASKNKERATFAVRFFKAGKGEYAEGDLFLGSTYTVPQIRKLALSFAPLPLEEIDFLLQNKYHEVRLAALFILVRAFEKGSNAEREKIVKFYLKHTNFINNWDLVDSTAYKILGPHLVDKPREILYKLAKSNYLWERRIGMIATHAFIRRGEFADALAIAEILRSDPHDLIHKAVGWMLREIGSRNRRIEEEFLKKYAASMPRTMLRYAIEKFPEPLRAQYLAVKS